MKMERQFLGNSSSSLAEILAERVWWSFGMIGGSSAHEMISRSRLRIKPETLGFNQELNYKRKRTYLEIMESARFTLIK
jgi:hypothetical protein